MKKWEYKLVSSNSFKKPGLLKDFAPADIELFLNKLGQQGWEIIHFDCKFKQKDIELFSAVAKRESDGSVPQSVQSDEETTEPEE